MSVEGLAVVITALSGLITAFGLVLTNRSRQVTTDRKADRKLIERYEKRDQKSLLHIARIELELIDAGRTPPERPTELGPEWLFQEDNEKKAPKAVSS
jgi:hypothetical protein